MNKGTKLVLALLGLALCLGVAGCGQDEVRQVSVYNWTEYMPQEVLDDFKAETGIEVVYSTYESNEAMYAKVKLQGGEGYDIVVPSTYFVSRMVKEGMLAEIDQSKLTNMKNLDPAILDKPYDPGNKHSIPYMWGGTGLMYDTRKVTDAPTSWKALWDPKYAGHIMLQDDLREVFGIAQLLLGHSINDTDPAHIEEAYELLRSMVPGVRVFNSDNPKMPFLNEEVDLGMIWSGEGWQAEEEKDTLHFVWPDEGGILWMDNLVVVKDAKHYDEAMEFINYLLRPDVAAKICEDIGYATPNKAAIALLPDELKDSKVIFPSEDVLKKSEFQNDVGDAIVTYEEYWSKLKSGL